MLWLRKIENFATRRIKVVPLRENLQGMIERMHLGRDSHAMQLRNRLKSELCAKPKVRRTWENGSSWRLQEPLGSS